MPFFSKVPRNDLKPWNLYRKESHFSVITCNCCHLAVNKLIVVANFWEYAENLESHQKSYKKIREISLYWFLKLRLCSDFDEFAVTGAFILTKENGMKVTLEFVLSKLFIAVADFHDNNIKGVNFILSKLASLHVSGPVLRHSMVVEVYDRSDCSSHYKRRLRQRFRKSEWQDILIQLRSVSTGILPPIQSQLQTITLYYISINGWTYFLYHRL